MVEKRNTDLTRSANVSGYNGWLARRLMSLSVTAAVVNLRRPALEINDRVARRVSSGQYCRINCDCIHSGRAT